MQPTSSAPSDSTAATKARPESVERLAFQWIPRCAFHHIGFVVASIPNAIGGFAAGIGGQWDGEIIHDPRQMVRVAFLRAASADDPLIELVEPDGERSPVMRFLERGGGLHHICFETPDLERQLEESRAKGGLVASPPQPAVAFGGRRIAWIYTKERLLVEYLERRA